MERAKRGEGGKGSRMGEEIWNRGERTAQAYGDCDWKVRGQGIGMIGRMESKVEVQIREFVKDEKRVGIE